MSNIMETSNIAGGGFDILLAHPGHAETVVREARRVPQLDSLRGERGPRWGGYRLEQRAALIPVIGPLVPRGPVGLARFGLTSYEGLRDELRQAAADADVDTIVLMIDSPGGYVTGVDATGDAILAARRTKPVVAVVEGMAASAAYWIASQADRIIVAPFGAVGSIGALAVHMDLSRALDAAGVTVTVVRAGAKKAEGNPWEPLTDEARAELQATLEKVRTAFAGAVVAGRARPDLDAATVLATEARMFDADEAVALGLVDQIGSLDGFVASAPPRNMIRRSVPGLAVSLEDPAMAAGPAAGPVDEAPAVAVTPQRVEPPDAPPLPVQDATVSTNDLRSRASAIFAHPFSVTEMGQAHAHRLAFESEKPTEEAIAELDVIARIVADSKTRAAPTLDEEMAADVQPTIGQWDAGSGSLTPYEKGALEAARVLGKDPQAALAKLRGHSPGTVARPEDPTLGAVPPPAPDAAATRWPR